MRPLRALFAAERVKWRKSWILVAAVLAPLCQVGFLGLLFWFSGSRVRMFKPGFQFWVELNCIAWNLVVMPITAALVSDLSWDQERLARAWNHLLVQPHAWRSHFAVKLLGHLVLLLGALALFAVTLTLGGHLLQRNTELLMGPLPLPFLLRFLGYSALALLPVVAFHTWLSMRVPGTWVACASALAGSWLAFRLIGKTPLLPLLPWGLAAQAALMFERWRVALPWVQTPLALVAAAVMVAVGLWDFARRRETAA